MSGNLLGSKVAEVPSDAQANGVPGRGGHLHRIGVANESVCS